MSFSKEIKEELSKLNNLNKKQEVLCEFWGYLASNNINENEKYLKYSTENEFNIDRFAKITRNTGIEDFEIDIIGKTYFIKINKMYINNLNKFMYDTEKAENIKAYIRGIFMGAGSMNNPERKYHLEIQLKEQAEIPKIIKILNGFDINIKQRENIMYLKDGEEISKFLAFIGAVKSVLKFEEIRVQRHMNNKVNRLVNCKTANLNKVLNASVEQINAIRNLRKSGEFERLDENLKEIALLRLENPDMSLLELGKKLKNPIGKSGVNYRLKKLVQIAEKGIKVE